MRMLPAAVWSAPIILLCLSLAGNDQRSGVTMAAASCLPPCICNAGEAECSPAVATTPAPALTPTPCSYTYTFGFFTGTFLLSDARGASVSLTALDTNGQTLAQTSFEVSHISYFRFSEAGYSFVNVVDVPRPIHSIRLTYASADGWQIGSISVREKGGQGYCITNVNRWLASPCVASPGAYPPYGIGSCGPVMDFTVMLATPCSLLERPCPAGCVCSCILVDCSNAGLANMPADGDYPPATESLDLSGNSLTSIAVGSFRRLAASITRLDLSSNKLGANFDTFSPDVFGNCSKLSFLDLSYNDITQIPASLFVHLPNLHSLLLSDNLLPSIPASCFFPLNSTAFLHVGGNLITSIGADAFAGLPNPHLLQILELSFNMITYIHPNAFVPLTTLSKLELSRQLRRPPTMAGLQLPALTFPYFNWRHSMRILQLILTGNALTEIPSDIAYLEALVELHLGRNLLTSIPIHTFDALTKLERLHLYSNRFTVIPVMSLRPLFRPDTHLQFLDFAFNQLTSLSEAEFVDMVLSNRTSTTSLSMCFFGNPFVCCGYDQQSAALHAKLQQILPSAERCSGSDATDPTGLGIQRPTYVPLRATCDEPPLLLNAILQDVEPLDLLLPCPAAPAPAPTPYAQTTTPAPVIAPSISPAPTLAPSTAPSAATGRAGQSSSGSAAAGAAPIVAGVMAAGLGVALVALFVCRRRRVSHQTNILYELRELIAREQVQADEMYQARFAETLGSLEESSRRIAELPIQDPLSLKIGDELGRGQFARVCRADQDHAQPDMGTGPGRHGSGSVSVYAIKLLHENMLTGQPCVNLLLEIRVMAMLRHPHIVAVVGARNRCPPISLVLELCDGGDLRSFLRGARDSAGPGVDVEVDVPHLKPSVVALEWGCWQVASAMAYLHSKLILHRDLAARNVLVQRLHFNTECPFTLKLSDLGLSRAVGVESDYYLQSCNDRIPIKWMCPIAVALRRFSKKSDVWSYGVVVWEMFTYGASPWAHLAATEAVLMQEQGHRLERPPAVPDWLHELMQRCWCKAETERPSFAVIHAQLGKHLGAAAGASASASASASAGSSTGGLHPRTSGRARDRVSLGAWLHEETSTDS